MSDIVERLHNYSPYDEPEGRAVYTEAKLRTLAANEIERLRADNEQLRKITEHQSDLCIERLDEIERLREREDVWKESTDQILEWRDKAKSSETESLRALLAARKANKARLIEICRKIASGLRGKYVTRENMWKLAESAYEANAQNET